MLNFLFCRFPVKSQSPAPEPFQQCWEITVPEINKTQIASDNASQVYLSRSDGSISSINLMDGTSQWKTDLGGQTEKIIYDGDILYVLSADTQRQEEDVKEVKGNSRSGNLTIRAVSAKTGVVKWQKIFSGEHVSRSGENSLVFDRENLFLVTASGSLYKLSKTEGQEVEKINLGVSAKTQASMAGNNIYVGADKNLLIYSIPDRKVGKTPLNEPPNVVFALDNQVIIGDKLGKITALDTKGNKEWQTRTGAEITNITKTRKGIAVSSNDNFIYLISLKNGEKLWKKRFSGRTTAINSETDDDDLLIVNLNGDLSTFVETEKGKTINQVSIQKPKFFVNKPVMLKDVVIYHINTGLIAYSPAETCTNAKKTETTRSF